MQQNIIMFEIILLTTPYELKSQKALANGNVTFQAIRWVYPDKSCVDNVIECYISHFFAVNISLEHLLLQERGIILSKFQRANMSIVLGEYIIK